MIMSECEIPKINASDPDISHLLTNARSIAVVGLSPKPERPSHDIYLFLKSHGYNVFGINPGHSEILGDPVYKSLLDVPEQIDIVNVFRNPSAVPALVEEAISINAKGLWLQEGIVHNDAAARARSAGLIVVMNKCIYKELRRRL